jgi:hypothetical protein
LGSAERKFRWALSYHTTVPELELGGIFRRELRKGLSDGSYLELELGGQLRWILVHGGALAGGVQLRALRRHNADVGRAPVLFTEKFTLSISNFMHLLSLPGDHPLKMVTIPN